MAGLGRRSHYRKHITDSVLNTCPEPGKGERIAKVVGTRGSNQFEVILSFSSNKKSRPTCRGTETSTNAGSNIDSSSAAEASKQGGQQPQLQPQYQPPIVTQAARTPKLAILPTKYRKLVWLKRNDFVIVRCGQDDDEDAPSQSDDEKEGNTTTDHQAPSGIDEKVVEAAGGAASVVSGIRYEISHILYKDQVKHLQRKGLWPEDDPFFFEEGDAVGSDAAVAAIYSRTNQSYPDDEEQGKDHNKYDGDGGNDDGIIYDADDLLFVNTNKISQVRVEDSESDSDSDSDSGQGL